MHEQSDVPQEYQNIPVEQLKKGQGRFSHVVLVPQPSDDPNDPLNVSYVLETSCSDSNGVHSGLNGRRNLFFSSWVCLPP